MGGKCRLTFPLGASCERGCRGVFQPVGTSNFCGDRCSEWLNKS